MDWLTLQLGQDILVWGALFLIYFAIVHLVYYKKGITNGRNPVLLSTTALLDLLITIPILQKYLQRDLFTIERLVTITGLMVILIIVSFFIYQVFRTIDFGFALKSKKSQFDELSFKTPYLFPRATNVLLQELFVYALYQILLPHTVTTLTTAVAMALVFGGVHLFIILSFKNIRIALLFFLGGTALGFIIPFIISWGTYGYLLPYVVHYLFYTTGLPLGYLITSKLGFKWEFIEAYAPK